MLSDCGPKRRLSRDDLSDSRPERMGAPFAFSPAPAIESLQEQVQNLFCYGSFT